MRGPLSRGVRQDERARALGPGPREEQGKWAGVHFGQDGGPLAANGVQDAVSSSACDSQGGSGA
jgi:hypothetical protein